MSLSEEEAKEIAIKLQADKSFEFVSDKIEDSEKIVSFLDMPKDKQILIDQLFDRSINNQSLKTPKEIEGSLDRIEKISYTITQHIIYYALSKLWQSQALRFKDHKSLVERIIEHKSSRNFVNDMLTCITSASSAEPIRRMAQIGPTGAVYSDCWINHFKAVAIDQIQQDINKVRLLVIDFLDIDLTKSHPTLQTFFNLPINSSEYQKLPQNNVFELIEEIIVNKKLDPYEINIVEEYLEYIDSASFELKYINNGNTYETEANHYYHLEGFYKLGKQFSRLFMLPHENEIIRKYKQRKEAQKTKPDTEPWFELYKTLKTQNPTQSDLSISEEIAKQFKVDMQDSCKGKDKLPILVAREKVRGRLKPLVKKWKESQQKK